MTSSSAALMSVSPSVSGSDLELRRLCFWFFKTAFYEPRGGRMINNETVLLAKLGEISTRTRHGEVERALTVAAFPDGARVQVSAAGC